MISKKEIKECVKKLKKHKNIFKVKRLRHVSKIESLRRSKRAAIATLTKCRRYKVENSKGIGPDEEL